MCPCDYPCPTTCNCPCHRHGGGFKKEDSAFVNYKQEPWENLNTHEIVLEHSQE